MSFVDRIVSFYFFKVFVIVYGLLFWKERDNGYFGLFLLLDILVYVYVFFRVRCVV